MESSKSISRDEKLMRQKDDLQDLKGRQIEAATGDGEPLETIKANKNGKYLIRSIEAKGYVHVHTVVKHLNADQKDFLYDKRIVKIHAREFDRRVAEGAFKTYDEVEVIHDPRVNAPKSYNLKPDVAKVENVPNDKNVETKGTTKIQAAGKPGSGKTKADPENTDLGDKTPDADLGDGDQGAGAPEPFPDNQDQGGQGGAPDQGAQA